MRIGESGVHNSCDTVARNCTPSAIYEHPANIFVATFVGMPPMNLLAAEYVGGVIVVADQRLTPTARASRRRPRDGAAAS